ncbi:MAG TPA: MFS transporter [Candidatus Dormibacteraeota bacterium]|nr:MFS transporter [Candidatus Dormibacteraeota bacterium]
MSATVPRAREVQPRRRALGALRHRNYRLLLGGLLISGVGSWTQSLAQTWLVLRLTHSALMVGAVLAIQHLPALFAFPLARPLTAHYPRRRLLQVTQATSMLPSLLLFAATAAHVVTFAAVLIAALAQGIVQAVETPTRQAFVLEMVGREDLVNAISLNSAIGNLASVVGPAVAGLLISTAGLPLCFLVNAASDLAVIAATALVRDLPSLLGTDRGPSPLAGLVQGARYVRCDPIVSSMLIVAGTLALFGTNRLTVLPLFAEDVLGAGPPGFGFLVAAFGLGTLTAGLALPLVPYRGGRRQLWTGLAWPLLLAGFAVSRSLPLSIALLFLAGVCHGDFFAGIGSRVQAATPERLRGAVVALYSQVLIGVGPLGAMQAGALTALLGAPVAVGVGAGVAGLVVLGVRLLQPAAFTFELPD